MVRTTQNLLIAEEGAASVLKLCNANGWIGDFVRIDYGEDIIFQTNYREKMDPFRIYAQCKAFKVPPKRIVVHRHHFLKWLMMGELVVIFCYIKSTGKIRHYVANENKRFYDIWKLATQTVSIPIGQFNLSNKKSLQRLEWLSRIRGLSFLLSMHFMNRGIATAIKGARLGGKDKYSEELDETEIGILYQLFEYLGFCEIRQGKYSLVLDGGLKPILERIRARAGGVEPGEYQLSLRELLMLAIFYQWGEVSCGLPLHGAVAEALAFWLEVFVLTRLSEEGFTMELIRELRY